MTKTPSSESGGLTRRSLLQGASFAALAGTSLARPGKASTTPTTGAADALGEREISVALIGCGGRGTGAAAQALATDGPVRLVAMADAFTDRLERCHKLLAERAGERAVVPAENRYVGFDAYEKAIASGADVVILATPPGFRPLHFERAIGAGKHVFMEKPVAVDAPGVRRVLAASDEADRKGLTVGVGLQRHHDPAYRETLKRLHDGAIGDVVALRVYWNSAGVWVKQREPEQTEMEYQMRNWYYFNWLCGDHIVEQHIHNIDVGNWVKGGYPIAAQGQGGRQVRTGKEFGEIFDHHFVEFTYEDGCTMLSQCRHIKSCWNSVSEHAHGTSGSAAISDASIHPATGSEWRYDGEEADPYQVEHDDFFRAIRRGERYNEAPNGARSTMTAIMGRMATYSGQRISWADALGSELDLSPGSYAWEAEPPVLPDANGFYPVAIPGITRVV